MASELQTVMFGEQSPDFFQVLRVEEDEILDSEDGQELLPLRIVVQSLREIPKNDLVLDLAIRVYAKHDVYYTSDEKVIQMS